MLLDFTADFTGSASSSNEMLRVRTGTSVLVGPPGALTVAARRYVHVAFATTAHEDFTASSVVVGPVVHLVTTRASLWTDMHTKAAIYTDIHTKVGGGARW